MNFKDGQMLSAADGTSLGRIYGRIANQLLQLRNEAKLIGDDQLRTALEQAYFEAAAMRLMSGSPTGRE